MKSQKQAVIDAIKTYLPSFVLGKDIALVMLSKDQLESLKTEIGDGIMNATIEYSKPLVSVEVMAYARSMVMNHLKKAKELNGNQVYGVGPVVVQSKSSKVLSTLNVSILSEDLKAYVKTLT